MAENDFYHECRAAGEIFKTSTDWMKWLELNRHDVNKPVATHDGFQYNINDVCINPHTIERNLEGNLFGWTVKTANTQFGWIWGYDINTEKEAKLEALNFIIRQLEGKKPRTKNVNLLIWLAKKERQDIVHPQLELFE